MRFVATVVATWPLHAGGLRLSKVDRETSLPSCLDIAGYPGKCMMSQSPGACYQSDGNWMCWGPGQKMTNETCQHVLGADNKLVGFEGACEYTGHMSNPPADLSDLDKNFVACTGMPFYRSQCAPVSEMWGACYVDGAVDPADWICLQKTNEGGIDNARKGDCRTYLRAGTTDKSYTNACVFPKKREPIYRCDTVPTFKTETMKCVPERGHVGACFNDVETPANWMCFDNLNGTLFANCAFNLLPAPHDTKHYEGSCVFKDSPLYEKALNYS